MKRILFTEGIETYRLPNYVNPKARKIICATLAKYFEEIQATKEFEIYFAVSEKINNSFKEQCGKFEGIILCDGIDKKLDFNKNIKILKELLKDVSPDVIVTTNIDGFCTIASLTALYEKTRKLVIWQDRNTHHYLLKIVLKLLYPSLKRKIKVIAARNFTNYKEIIEILNLKPKLIPIGIDTEIYKLKTLNRNIDLLYVGRLSYEKGFDIFVKILKKLDSKIDKILNVLIITNGGPLEYLLNDLRFNKINIFVKKNIPWYKMSEYYSKCKILINTSRSEVFGQAMVEALACGCHVIATKTAGSSLIRYYVGGAMEIINNDNNLNLYLDLINKKLENFEINKAGRTSILKHLSGYAMAKKWLAIFKSLFDVDKKVFANK